LGILYFSIKPNPVSSLTPVVSPNPDSECFINHSIDTQEFSGNYWKGSLIYDDTGMQYVVYNLPLDRICKFPIYTFSTRPRSVSNFYVHHYMENKASFILDLNTGDMKDFVIVDLKTKVATEIPILKADQYYAYYGQYGYLNNQFLGSFILISPITLPAVGCEFEKNCAQVMAEMIQKDRNRDDVNAYLIRTDGKYISFKRRDLNKIDFTNFDMFRDFKIENSSAVFLKNSQVVFKTPLTF
jgi:hypothetical protein